MDAKQAYTLAYRTFRASKGSAVLRASVATRAAWNSYVLANHAPHYLYGDDPLHYTARYMLAQYGMNYATHRTKLLYRANTDYTRIFKGN